MIKILKAIFQGRAVSGVEKYSGFSDFLLHASSDEKKAVMQEAARKANKDQMKVFEEARLKTAGR